MKADRPARIIRFPLETERLLIRPMEADDAADLHAVYGDAETMRYLTEQVPRNVEETRGWMAAKMDQHTRDGISLWSVVERATGRVIGDCGLQYEDDEHSDVALGFRFNRALWGRGYGREATAACLTAGFEQLGVGRILAGTDVENARARRLLTWLGMRYVREGSWYGRRMAEYEILAAEWQPR
ncbi:MAG: GNAT family N-acetyltransferase [Candidatus Limnocylindria bacterium]